METTPSPPAAGPPPAPAAPKRPRRTEAAQLEAARLLLEGWEADEEIKTALADLGYDDAARVQARTLYQAAQNASLAQTARGGLKQGAHGAKTTAYDAAQDAYQKLATVARGLFKNEPGKLAQLGLVGNVPADEAGFLQAARTLFSVAQTDPAILSALAARRYDAARLATQAAVVDAFAQARTQQTGALGDAQQASRDEDAAFAALHAWTGEFLPNARQALKAKPELLEKMGVTARSSAAAARRKPAG